LSVRDELLATLNPGRTPLIGEAEAAKVPRIIVTPRMPEPPTTLAGVNDLRRDQDLPTTAFVVGDFTLDPPVGRATARRVADLIVDDGKIVEFEDREQLGAGDVLLLSMPNPLPRDTETWREILDIQKRGRAAGLAGLVIHTNALDSTLIVYVDVRVVPMSGGADRVEKIHREPYSDEVVATELEGLA